MACQRESLSSRLGFILLSVGCAVGLGNVWRFPYVTGKYGGGMFVLLYLLCLICIGFPLLAMELSIGRGGRSNLVHSMQTLSGGKTSWKFISSLAFCGNILLMMYYTTIAGWLMYYAAGYISGNDSLCTTTGDNVESIFNSMTGSWQISTSYMVAVVALSSLMCSSGLRKGVEKSTKVMMTILFLLIAVMAVYALTLPGAGEGLSFYLKPDFDKFSANFGETLFAALGQAFFTLSIGAGSMTVFGSYIGKERRLTEECITIISLDTLIALLAGLIIFPICFSFNVSPAAGPGLIFVSMPNVFKTMAGARWWGSAFFIFLTLAALTTVVAVFENIICFIMERWNMKRPAASLITGISIALLSMPCILGCNVLKTFHPLGKESSILDLEDFIVSQNLLPFGAFFIALFCSHKFGWNWQNFIAEVNTGCGLKFPTAAKFYCKWLLPMIIMVIFLIGYKQIFQ